MPLFELFRLAKGKLDPIQEKPSSSPPDSSPIPGNDFAELTLENGQVLLQGQCNSSDKKSLSPNTNSLTPHSSKLGGGDNEREGKIGILGCGLGEFPASVPSAGVSLNQVDEMVPWLHYPISGSLNGDYSSDFLSELPGVTVNENSVGNNFESVAKSDQGQLCRESRFSSLQSRSGLEEGTRTRTSNMQLLPSSLPLQSQTPPASGLKLQRADFTPSSNTSSVMNFPYFSRPTTVMRGNIESDNKVAGLDLSRKEWIRSRDMDADVTNTSNLNPCRQTSVPGQGSGLKIPAVKSSREPVSARKNEAVILADGLKEDKFSNQSWRTSGTKGGVADVENTLELVGGSSSVCSGNGVERALDDLKQGFKRKSHETEESEDHSEDFEEELVSAKKQTTARDTPLRRSRAAEVHNLSERRRRDRINEKMRALQELIPNCNKVDKASMLDEAIEYIKTLKLQLQMATMGAGLYMMPMMLPTGMQHLGHLPHYPNMGMGMGHGLEFGMGMFHKNMQGRHIPGPLIPGMHAIAGSMYGLHGQGFPLPMPRAPLVTLSGSPVMKPATGPKNASAPMEDHDPATVSSGRESVRSINVQKTSSSCLTEQQRRSQSMVAPSSGQALDKKRARGDSD